MEKDELLNLGVEESVADAIVEDARKTKEEYEERIARVRREGEVELLLMESGARNTDVLRALINPQEDAREQIERLKNDKDTSFLFEKRKSFEPRPSAKRLPDSKKNDFEERLMDARRRGNSIEAIRIKQQAANEGIMLL